MNDDTPQRPSTRIVHIASCEVINSNAVLNDILERADKNPKIAEISKLLGHSQQREYQALRKQLALDFNFAHSMRDLPGMESSFIRQKDMSASGTSVFTHMQGLVNLSLMLNDYSPEAIVVSLKAMRDQGVQISDSEGKLLQTANKLQQVFCDGGIEQDKANDLTALVISGICSAIAERSSLREQGKDPDKTGPEIG